MLTEPSPGVAMNKTDSFKSGRFNLSSGRRGEYSPFKALKASLSPSSNGRMMSQSTDYDSKIELSAHKTPKTQTRKTIEFQTNDSPKLNRILSTRSFTKGAQTLVPSHSVDQLPRNYKTDDKSLHAFYLRSLKTCEDTVKDTDAFHLKLRKMTKDSTQVEARQTPSTQESPKRSYTLSPKKLHGNRSSDGFSK